MGKNVLQQSPPEGDPPEEVRVRRASERASYDNDAVNEVIDSAVVAHVGTVRDGKPVVIPMFIVRDGEHLLLHGAPAAGVLRRGKGADVCVTMTLLDGLVLARSGLHHSLNYRSAVVIGSAEPVENEAEKERALELFMERLVPTRQADLRPTTEKEIRGTAVLRVSLAQASVKARSGPPIDDEEDYELGMWAGVVPVTTSFGEPEADPRLNDGIEVPANVEAIVGRVL